MAKGRRCLSPATHSRAPLPFTRLNSTCRPDEPPFLIARLPGVRGRQRAWLDTSAQASRPASASGRLWWLSSTDQFGNQPIDRIDIAATGPNAPVPPGLPHLPGPGDYLASPAFTTLLRSEPANELRDRFPGRQTGTIGAAALPSPNSLIIVIGRTTRQLSRAPGAVEVGAIQRTPANCYACQSTIGSGPVLQFILAGGAVALLLPVLILAALDVHPRVAMQILRHSKIAVTMEIWVQVPSAAIRHSRRAPQAERSACLMVDAVCCCRKITNGRSMIWNRPPSRVGDTGIEPVTSSV